MKAGIHDNTRAKKCSPSFPFSFFSPPSSRMKKMTHSLLPFFSLSISLALFSFFSLALSFKVSSFLFLSFSHSRNVRTVVRTRNFTSHKIRNLADSLSLSLAQSHFRSFDSVTQFCLKCGEGRYDVNSLRPL